MTTDEMALVPASLPDLPVWLQATVEAALRYKEREYADATVAGYARDWRQFTRWCDATGLAPMPAMPFVITLYVTHLAESGRKIATIRRHLAAIVVQHRREGHDLGSTLRTASGFHGVWAGIRRTLPAAPTQKEAIAVDQLRAMVLQLPRTPAGVRDRALLLVTFVAAARRSEIADATWGALKRDRRGYELTIERSKTDQAGDGHTVVLPLGASDETCPVLALDTWRDLLVARGQDVSEHSPIFRQLRKGGHIVPMPMSPRAIAEVVQRAALAAGVAGVPGSEALDAKRVTAARARAALKRERSEARKAARIERRRLRRAGDPAAAEMVVAVVPTIPTGLPPSVLGGHSLRAGFVTSAVDAGVPTADIRRQTGHRSAVLERYIRRAKVWDKAAASKLGL